MSSRFRVWNLVRFIMVVCGAISAVYGASLLNRTPSSGFLKLLAAVFIVAGFAVAAYAVASKDHRR